MPNVSQVNLKGFPNNHLSRKQSTSKKKSGESVESKYRQNTVQTVIEMFYRKFGKFKAQLIDLSLKIFEGTHTTFCGDPINISIA